MEERRRNILVRTFHFLFSWKTIIWPWKNISTFWHWWWHGTTDWRYRTMAGIPAVIVLLALLAGPLWTTYPAVWTGTYFYNYYSVIYPKAIPQDKADEGKAIVKTMIKVGDQMLVNWQDNDLFISSSKMPYIGVDNPRNFQRGEILMYRRIMEEMRDTLTRKTANDYTDKNIAFAQNQFVVDTESWIWPRAESAYRDGVDHLKIFLANVEKRNAGLYATSHNLDKLLEKIANSLADPSQKLEDARLSDVPWYWLNFKVDDNYYEAQGSLYVTLQVLRAARIDFNEVLRAKQAVAQFDNMIRSIETSQSYLVDPFIVLNGKPGTGIANDSSVLASLLQTTNRNLDQLRKQLTN